MTRSPTVGLVALQGVEHRLMLEGLGARVVPLRSGADLVGPDGVRVNCVLLPGGESSTIDKLLRMFDLFEPLRASIAAGLPALGTCAGWCCWPPTWTTGRRVSVRSAWT